jgi:hypothetical protein
MVLNEERMRNVMEVKPTKLSPKKNGHGHATSYSVNLESAEIREAGFFDADGNLLPIEKFIDTENHEIVIRLRAGELFPSPHFVTNRRS